VPRRKRGQRGCIVQIGDSFFIKYRDCTGKQKMLGERPGHGFTYRADAQARLNEILVELDKGDYIEPRKATFRQFAEEWQGTRNSIKGSTSSAYESVIRTHLVPAFGPLLLSEINLLKVQAFVDDLKTKVSTKTVHNVVTLLHTMLSGKRGISAIKAGYLRHNSGKGAELPKRTKPKVMPPTPEQVWQLLDKAEELAASNPVAAMGRSAIFIDSLTGLRRGELLALQYADIHWDQGEILVRQSITKVKATDGVHKWRWEIGLPKNDKERRVALPPMVADLLRGLRKTAQDRDGYVFTPVMFRLKHPSYRFLDPDYLDASVFAPIAEAAGLAGYRFHDLRHFFASMLIAQGESAKYVCDQMGHSSIQVTYDTYGHLFPSARPEAAAKLQAGMFAARSSRDARLVGFSNRNAKSSRSDGVLVEKLVEMRPFLVKKAFASRRGKKAVS
jgi:integrase